MVRDVQEQSCADKGQAPQQGVMPMLEGDARSYERVRFSAGCDDVTIRRHLAGYPRRVTAHVPFQR